MKEQLALLNELLNSFTFESPAQEKSLRSFVLWLRRIEAESLDAEMLLPLFITWNMERTKEAQEWIISTMGDHLKRLENQIADLRQARPLY